MATINLINARIQQKIDSVGNWSISNPVLLCGEIAIAVDEKEEAYIKIGDGKSNFNDLQYVGHDHATSAQVSSIANEYSSAVESKLTAYQPKGDYLLSSNLSFSYNSTAKKIYLSAQGAKVGEVDCVDFIKDGMLSSAVLVGNTLVLTFNTDAGKTPISVDLAKFVDNYDSKINSLSNAISNVVKDYTTSAQASAIANAYSSIVDNKLTGYYKKTETSSSTEIANSLTSLSNILSSYTDTVVAGVAAEIPTKVSELENDSGYLTAHQSLTAYETKADLTANYYKKTETSSYSQLKTEFARYQLTGDYRTGSQISTIAQDYATTVDNKLSAYQPKGNYLLSSNLAFAYDTTSKKINLSAFGNKIGQVDCTDFIKDGMLSTAALVGNTLVLTFNTDAGATPISVDLAKFVDNYDDKIKFLSDSIDIIGDDYLDSNDKLQFYNDFIELDELTLYKGPGSKDVTLSIATGGSSIQHTVTLSDFTTSSETSAIAQAYANSVKIADYTTSAQASAIANAYANAVDNKLTGYYLKTETSSDSQLKTEFEKYQPSGDYRTGTEISGIASAYAISVDSKLTAYETKADLTANYYTKSQTNALSTTFREGLETVADLTSNYYKKTETSSATELETAFSEKSKVIIRTWED